MTNLGTGYRLPRNYSNSCNLSVLYLTIVRNNGLSEDGVPIRRWSINNGGARKFSANVDGVTDFTTDLLAQLQTGTHRKSQGKQERKMVHNCVSMCKLPSEIKVVLGSCVN